MAIHTFQDSPREFNKLFIVGAGGFGREVAWLDQQVWGDQVHMEFAVTERQYPADDINGLRVVLVSDIEPQSSARFVVALGNPEARRKMVNLCRTARLRETSIVHPRAEISSQVELGDGTIICAGVIVLQILKSVVTCKSIWTVRLVMMSRSAISAHSPGVHVSGRVAIGERAFIGTGANIINGQTRHPLTIGDGAIVAAGACVTKNVPNGVMVAGVPAVVK